MGHSNVALEQQQSSQGVMFGRVLWCKGYLNQYASESSHRYLLSGPRDNSKVASLQCMDDSMNALMHDPLSL